MGIRPFVFETQRWLIESLFGWRGDEFERAKFDEFYDEQHTQVVQIDDESVGWLTVLRETNRIEVDASISRQNGKVVASERI